VWRRAAIAVVALILVLLACRWRPDTGFASLIRFGEDFASRQLPEIRVQNVPLFPGEGYDGQFYAHLAVEPDLQRPELAEAIPGLSYRARRILLPWVAHLLGFGQPGWVLQIYALLNVAGWLAFAWVWARECPPDDATGFARWATGVLALGTLDSLRMALTDLPATLMIILGVRAALQARPWISGLWLAAGGLVRETTLLAAFAGWRSDAAKAAGYWTTRVVACVPVVGWSAWLLCAFPHEPSNLFGNIDWPGAAFVRHLAHCLTQLSQGDWNSRYTFGLIGALGLAGQSLYFLRRWRSADLWIQTALPFALLLWVLGDFVWHGYWAAVRVVLPMTVAFARTAPVGWGYALSHLTVLHGIYRFIP
jgi:hypothetical protein